MKLKKSEIDWDAVGRRLRELRGFEMNQKELANRLGVSQAQLSRYEKGLNQIRPEVLVRISEEFGKRVEWLLAGKE